MGWWKADRIHEAPVQQTPTPPPPQPAARPPAATSTPDDSACPVDSKTRELWLQQAQAKAKAASHTETTLPPNHPPLPPTADATLASKECSSNRITGQSAAPPTPSPTTHKTARPLSQDRTVSSIPRSASPTTPGAAPANNETETGPHPSGNWIYPSESQFYNAVMQKQTASDPNALLSSISHIIPIHNAVNERAWTLIRSWEGSASDSCGGPKLASFSGKGAGASTPRAKWNTMILGKLEPFDRHDWVVERCDGQTVDYVIDFYQGKGTGSDNPNDKNVNFFLDVRPKLNSVEGIRMRAERMLGRR